MALLCGYASSNFDNTELFYLEFCLCLCARLHVWLTHAKFRFFRQVAA